VDILGSVGPHFETAAPIHFLTRPGFFLEGRGVSLNNARTGENQRIGCEKMRRQLPEWILPLVLTFGIWMPCPARAADEPSPARVREYQVGTLLDLIAEGKPLDTGAEAFLPDFIETVARGDSEDAALALRALTQLKPHSAAAVAAIVGKLDDSSYRVRGLAVEALVAIGDPATERLHGLVGAESARVRAGAVTGLTRLGKLELAEARVAAGDADPRVRVAAARGLASQGAEAVPQLLTLLEDSELPVQIAAIRALKAGCHAPESVVPILVAALDRKELHELAVATLSAYGCDARRAIPDLLEKLSPNVVRASLRHIGPPDARDVERLVPFLTNQNLEIQTLAARCLDDLGRDARPAVPAMQRVFDETLGELSGKEGDRVSFLECLCVATWHATGDVDPFLQMVVRLAAKTEMRHRLVLPWEELADKDLQRVRGFLDSTDQNLQSLGLTAAGDLGPRMKPLHPELFRLAREQAGFSVEAINVLVANSPETAGELEPILLTKVREKEIGLERYAQLVGRLRIQSEEAQQLLEQGLSQGRTLRQCAQALCLTTRDPEKTGSRILEALASYQIGQRDAVAILGEFRDPPPAVRRYLADYARHLLDELRKDRQRQNEEELEDEEETPNDQHTPLVADLSWWARLDLITRLGTIGPPASAAIPAIRGYLDDRELAVRHAAAAAIERIQGGRTALAALIETEFQRGDVDECTYLLRLLEAEDRRFPQIEQYLLRRLHDTADPLDAEDLGRWGSAAAIPTLEAAAKSRDWAMRVAADRALVKIRQRTQKEQR
jgi:HEAT repeat protein